MRKVSFSKNVLFILFVSHSWPLFCLGQILFTRNLKNAWSNIFQGARCVGHCEIRWSAIFWVVPQSKLVTLFAHEASDTWKYWSWVNPYLKACLRLGNKITYFSYSFFANIHILVFACSRRDIDIIETKIFWRTRK